MKIEAHLKLNPNESKVYIDGKEITNLREIEVAQTHDDLPLVSLQLVPEAVTVTYDDEQMAFEELRDHEVQFGRGYPKGDLSKIETKTKVQPKKREISEPRIKPNFMGMDEDYDSEPEPDDGVVLPEDDIPF